MNTSLTTFQRVLLAVILLEIPLRLDVHLDYHEAEAAYGALGGWSISVTTICLGVLYGAWLAAIAAHKLRPRQQWIGGILPGLIYLSVVALSVVVAQKPILALFELFSLFQAFLIFLYLFRWIRRGSDLRFVVTLLMVGLVLQSACMLGLYAWGHSIQFPGIDARLDAGGRVGGTVGAPNEAGSYLALLLPVALGVILAGWSRRSRMLGIACVALGTAALITTQSRGGWIGYAVGLSFFLIAALFQRRISILVPTAIGLTALVVGLTFQSVIVARLTKSDRGSAYSRITLMEVAMRVVEDAPILGSGANNLAVAMLPYAQSSNYRGTFMYVVHNRHMQVLAETGLAGLVAWLVFLFSALLRGWRSWRINDRFFSPIALGAVAGIAGEMVHMSGEVFGGRAPMEILWVLAALTAILYRWTMQTAVELQAASCNGSPVPASTPSLAGVQSGVANSW